MDMDFITAQRELMARSLVMVGEMGINDYLVAFFAKRTPSEVEPLVPHVIQAVRSLVNVSTTPHLGSGLWPSHGTYPKLPSSNTHGTMQCRR